MKGKGLGTQGRASLYWNFLSSPQVDITSYKVLISSTISSSTRPKWLSGRVKLPGGYSQKNWVGMCSLLPKTLTLFISKFCDFPYFIYEQNLPFSIPYLWPIYDLTKNLIPYTLFMTWYPISSQNGGKMAKIATLFLWLKRLENHTLWDCTYLYSLYNGVPPRLNSHHESIHNLSPNIILVCSLKARETKIIKKIMNTIDMNSAHQLTVTH